jgi:fucose permease
MTSHSEQPRKTDAGPGQYLSVWLACAAFLLLGVASAAFGVLLPDVRDDYEVTNAAIGLFFLATTGGYLIAALVSGTLVTCMGQRGMLLLGTAVFGIGYLLLGLEPFFVGALAARFVASLGVGGLEAGINIGLAARPNSSPVLNVAHAFWGVGALIGPPLASTLVTAGWEWPRVFLLFAVLSLPLLAAFGWPRRTAGAPVMVAALALTGGVTTASETRVVIRLAALFLIIYVGIEATLGNWGYSLLTEEYKLSGRVAGWAISGYWLGLTAARLTLAPIAARRGIGDRRLIQASMAGIAAGVLLIGVGAHAAVAVTGFALAGFALGPLYSTALSALAGRLPRERLASAIGLVTSLSVLGAAVGPWFAGIVAQYLSLWSLAPYCLAMTMMLWWLWRSLGVSDRQ